MRQSVAADNAKRVLGRRCERGFSLVELLVSIAILTILLIISIPTLLKAYRSYQLKDAASRFSGILKSARFSAIRKNTPVACQVKKIGANWTIWVDLDGDGNAQSTEPQTQVGGLVSLLDGGSVPAPTAIAAAMGPASPPLNVLSPGNVSVTYDQRGARKFPGTPPVPSVDVFYLGNPNIADLEFCAVVLLPSGTVQVWSAGPGGTWQRIS
jgi:type IV fimbrial biogenesis protein FimT